MLITFIALIDLVDGILGGIHIGFADIGTGFPRASNKFSAGLFSPVAWVIGIPWHDCTAIGNLLGTAHGDSTNSLPSQCSAR